MQYRIDKRSGHQLSILGFGCMRFPRVLTQIDLNRTEQLILKAIDGGVNYFDTAYMYSGSEVALGAVLAKNRVRDRVFLATKLPLGRCKTFADFEKLLQAQFAALQTDYIDYYLMHNIGDVLTWERLCALGIEKWLKEKKECGQIKNVGFSFHGVHDQFIKLLDVYDWDFCQIQYNYLNINYQAGRAGLQRAAEKGLPVIIMEPLLGGKLATGLPKKVVAQFKKANGSITPAAWALRWLWNQEAVTVVLSGMNDMKQLDDNLETASDALPGMLSPVEVDTYSSVIKIIEDGYEIPCTGCNYCLPCPQNVNIPACFTAYNAYGIVGMISGFQLYVTATGLLKTSNNYAASNCIACGACEKKCPQHIPIVESLKKVRKKLEPFWFRTALRIVMKLFFN